MTPECCCALVSDFWITKIPVMLDCLHLEKKEEEEEGARSERMKVNGYLMAL